MNEAVRFGLPVSRTETVYPARLPASARDPRAKRDSGERACGLGGGVRRRGVVLVKVEP